MLGAIRNGFMVGVPRARQYPTHAIRHQSSAYNRTRLVWHGGSVLIRFRCFVFCCVRVRLVRVDLTVYIAPRRRIVCLAQCGRITMPASVQNGETHLFRVEHICFDHQKLVRWLALSLVLSQLSAVVCVVCDNRTQHEGVANWVLDRIRLAQPQRVHLCDGSERENTELLNMMTQSGMVEQARSRVFSVRSAAHSVCLHRRYSDQIERETASKFVPGAFAGE